MTESGTNTRAIVVRLPWPAPALSPNARHAHWGQRARARARQKHEAGWLAHEAGVAAVRGAQRLSVAVTFYPPDQRARDTDNMLASVKGALDGIADVCGVDDSRWEIAIRRGEPTPGGAVVVRLTGVNE